VNIVCKAPVSESLPNRYSAL